MINLYYETTRKIGYDNPPPVILKKLKKDQLALSVKSWTGSGLNSDNILSHIEIDEEQMLSDAPINPAWIIAHELAHWRCRFIVGGGGMTSDGEAHGASFLACWLQMLIRLGARPIDIKEMAYWHAKKYKLTTEKLFVAAKAAFENDNPDAAANAAIIAEPMPFWHRAVLTAFITAFATYFFIMFK